MAFLRHSALVWSGTATAALLAFTVQVLIARMTGPAGLAVIGNAYAVASLVGIFGFQGVGELVLRHRRSMPRQPATMAMLAMSLAGAVAATLWASWVELEPETRSLLLWMIPFAVVHVGLLAGMTAAQARFDSTGIALWPVLLQVGRVLPLPLIALLDWPLWTVPLAWAVCLTPFGIAGVRRLDASFAPTNSTEAHDSTPVTSSTILREALPFSLTRVIEYAELQLPVILAVSLFAPESAGWVAAGLTLMQGLLLLPIALFHRLLRPRFHALASSSPRDLRRWSLLGTAAMFLAGLAAAVVIHPFADLILKATFGSAFDAGARFLEHLLWVVPVWFAATTVGATMVTRRQADVRSVSQTLGILMLAGISWMLAPTFGLDALVIGIAANQGLLLTSGVGMVLVSQRGARDDTPAPRG